LIKIDTINHFELVDYQRKYLITSLLKFNSEQLHFTPAAGSWSVAQVIEHLYLVENISKLSIEKKLLKSKNNLKNADWRSGLRKNILGLIFALPIKTKVPIEAIKPTENNFETAKENWIHIGTEFKPFLHQLDKEYFQKELFMHPKFGGMRMMEMFKFLHMHTEHHTRQIDRISRHPNFPQ
jgi:DinB superfamily